MVERQGDTREPEEAKGMRMYENPPPGALVAPAAARNRDPILAELRKILPDRGRVLEIASGSGEHALHFAAALPGIVWQPSDPDEAALASIEAYRAGYSGDNLLAPLRLDAREPPWPVGPVDAVVSINMIHIAPWEACEGLMRGAAQVLRAGGGLVLYGPFNIDGRFTAPSNEAFDASLRARDPAWGIRDLAAVRAVAENSGLRLERSVDMPANNRIVHFVRG
jgi:cyclopropane fatty-acyl-phospholipid synthase-like methyltransferase